MASKKISQLKNLDSSQIQTDDLLTLVDVSETDVTKINKKTKIGDLTDYLRNKSNLFPIPFTEDYINSDALVEDKLVPISEKVKGKTVNVSDIGALKFDQFGRVYDYTANNQIATSDSVLLGSGTAASFYKTEITSDFDNPQPVSAGRPVSSSLNFGYFNQYSYWNPLDFSTTASGAYSVTSKINYSNKLDNDYDWRYLFNTKYDTFTRTSINVNYSLIRESGKNFEQQLSNLNLEIFWDKNLVIGTGIFSASVNLGYSFIFNETLNGGENQEILPFNYNNGTSSLILKPALYITSGTNKRIDGLPIPCWTNNKNEPINQPVQVSIQIKSI